MSNLPQFTGMHPKSKTENNSDKHWTILAYTFTKLGGNLSNNDGDPTSLARSANLPEGLYILLALISFFFLF